MNQQKRDNQNNQRGNNSPKILLDNWRSGISSEADSLQLTEVKNVASEEEIQLENLGNRTEFSVFSAFGYAHVVGRVKKLPKIQIHVCDIPMVAL